MICVFLMAEILITLVGVYTLSKTNVHNVKDYTGAINHARAHMEWLRAQGYDDLSTNKGTFNISEQVVIDLGMDLDNDGIFDDGEGIKAGQPEDELEATRTTLIQSVADINDDDGDEDTTEEIYLRLTVTAAWHERISGLRERSDLTIYSDTERTESLVTYMSP